MELVANLENEKKLNDDKINELNKKLKICEGKDTQEEITNPKIISTQKLLERKKNELEKIKAQIQEWEEDSEWLDDEDNKAILIEEKKQKESTEKQILELEKRIEKIKEEEDSKKVHLINCQVLEKSLKVIENKISDNYELLKNNDSDNECCEIVKTKLDQLIQFNQDEISKKNKELEEKFKKLEAEKEELLLKLKNEVPDKKAKEKLIQNFNNKISELENNLIQAEKDQDNEKINKLTKKLEKMNEIKKISEDINKANIQLEKAKKAGDKEKVKEYEQEIKKLEDKQINDINIETNTEIQKYRNELENLQQEKTKLEERLKNLDRDKFDNNKVKNLGEFKVTTILTIQDFVSDNVRDKIIAEMRQKYPKAVINEDYLIEFESLNKDDILNTKELNIIIKPVNSRSDIKETKFVAKISYDYSNLNEVDTVDKILKPSIPNLFWNSRNNKKYDFIHWSAGTYNKVADHVQSAKPLNWLLDDEPTLTMKIAAELVAATGWTNFHARWWAIHWSNDSGLWPAYSVIPSANRAIKNVKGLYDINNIYFNRIFYIIEKRLKDLGINCRVAKKRLKDYNNAEFSHGVGNLKFGNNYNDVSKKYSNYYIQVNFDVIFENGISQEYPGVLFYLSNDLKIYN